MWEDTLKLTLWVTWQREVQRFLLTAEFLHVRHRVNCDTTVPPAAQRQECALIGWKKRKKKAAAQSPIFEGGGGHSSTLERWLCSCWCAPVIDMRLPQLAALDRGEVCYRLRSPPRPVSVMGSCKNKPTWHKHQKGKETRNHWARFALFVNNNATLPSWSGYLLIISWSHWQMSKKQMFFRVEYQKGTLIVNLFPFCWYFVDVSVFYTYNLFYYLYFYKNFEKRAKAAVMWVKHCHFCIVSDVSESSTNKLHWYVLTPLSLNPIPAGETTQPNGERFTCNANTVHYALLYL